MEMIKNKRVLALVGIICLLAGTFLPYIKISFFTYSYSISLWGYWEGKIVLALTLANALFIFKDWIEKNIPQLFNNNIGRLVEKANNPKFSLVPTILIAGFAIYMLNTIDADSDYIKYGMGFWTLWLGVLSLVGHAIFYKKTNNATIEVNNNIQPNNVNVQTNDMNVNYQQFSQPVQSAAPQVEQTKKQCPYCRSEANADAQFCVSCGNKF